MVRLAVTDLLTAAEAAARLQRLRCARDPAYFIERYVQIEDKDSPGGTTPFVLWPGQRQALDAFTGKRLAIVLKARQLGLTWLALAYAIWRMLFRPGYAVVMLSRRDEDAKELVRRMVFILERLPRWMTRNVKDAAGFDGPTWEDTTHSITIRHPGAVEARAVALPAAKDTARSLTANLLLIDEWAAQEWAREIWQAAYPTINRPGGGQVIGLSTGKRGTLFEEIWNGARGGANDFAAVFLPWHADPRRTREWYEATKRALSLTYRAEYPQSEGDAFTVGEGAAFPEWDESVHVLPAGHPWEHPPKSWPRYRAYDFGFVGPACCKWYALSPDGMAACYREYYPVRVKTEDQAREIVRMSRHPDGKPERIESTIADTQCWTPQSDTGETIAETFGRCGVPMVQADKERVTGWTRLRSWLAPLDGPDGRRTAMLRFSRFCANTIRTYPGLQQKPTDPEDVKDGEDHTQDCDRYFVMSRPQPVAPKAYSPSEALVAARALPDVPWQLRDEEATALDWRDA